MREKDMEISFRWFWDTIENPSFRPEKYKALRKLRAAIERNFGGRIGANMNFIAVCYFIGFENAQKLMRLVHRGKLYIPAGRNKRIVDCVGEQASFILRNNVFRFIFKSYMHGLGRGIAIEFPQTLMTTKQDAIAIQLAIIDSALRAPLQEASKLPQTQKEKADYFGVAQPDICKISNSNRYGETLKNIEIRKKEGGSLRDDWKERISPGKEYIMPLFCHCANFRIYQFHGELWSEITKEELDSFV